MPMRESRSAWRNLEQERRQQGAQADHEPGGGSRPRVVEVGAHRARTPARGDDQRPPAHPVAPGDRGSRSAHGSDQENCLIHRYHDWHESIPFSVLPGLSVISTRASQPNPFRSFAGAPVALSPRPDAPASPLGTILSSRARPDRLEAVPSVAIGRCEQTHQAAIFIRREATSSPRPISARHSRTMPRTNTRWNGALPFAATLPHDVALVALHLNPLARSVELRRTRIPLLPA